MNDSRKKPSGGAGIGCYVVLSYLFYWPAFWAMRAGVEWHASNHPGFSYDIGPPEFWAGAWFLAPVTMLFCLLGAMAYWVLAPVLYFIASVFV